MKTFFGKPSLETAKLVRHYLHLTNENEEYTDRFIPDGNIAIVFNFVVGNKFVAVKNVIQLPPYFITLPLIKSIEIETYPKIDSFIIICKASVLTNLFNIRFLENRLPLYLEIDLFNGFPMYHSLKNLRSFSDRMQLFENYLLENTNIKSYKKDNIDEFYEKIMLSKGDTRISSLLNSLNMNPRSFRRHFIRRVGISAKGLLRIVRVNYIWDNFRNNNNLNFYDVVYDCNFFDQAHLINDFKKIVGESPKRFFSRNLKYVESFSGKSFPVT